MLLLMLPCWRVLLRLFLPLLLPRLRPPTVVQEQPLQHAHNIPCIVHEKRWRDDASNAWDSGQDGAAEVGWLMWTVVLLWTVDNIICKRQRALELCNRTHARMCTCAWAHAHACAHAHAQTHPCTCVCVCVCAHVCVRTHTHMVHLCMCMCAGMCMAGALVHTCVRACACRALAPIVACR